MLSRIWVHGSLVQTKLTLFFNRIVHIKPSFEALKRVSKPHFYKNNAKLPLFQQNLHDSDPYFCTCLPKIWDRVVTILCGFALLL